MTIGCNIWMICLKLNWFFYSLSRMLQFSQFVWALRSSVWDVFINFLFIDATDRSKITSDQKRFFIALSLYPLSFFVNTPFNVILAVKYHGHIKFHWGVGARIFSKKFWIFLDIFSVWNTIKLTLTFIFYFWFVEKLIISRHKVHKHFINKCWTNFGQIFLDKEKISVQKHD